MSIDDAMLRRLAMAARAHMRRKFLQAKVAISGANFGVADTGTLAVVESEGNGPSPRHRLRSCECHP